MISEPIDPERQEAAGYWLERCRDVLAGCTPPDKRDAALSSVRTPNELDFEPRPPVVAPSVSDFDPNNAT